METPTKTPESTRSNFIRDIIDADLASGKYKKTITRFPPEPNGYLHIGHAKSICLNFGIARDYQGDCHLRFDDTDPTKEDPEYVEAIQQDIRWLGFDWNGKLFYASDYFEKLFEIAVYLIQKGKAYVDSLSLEEIREYRGTLSEPGRESPYRNRSVEENLDLFARMRAGEFKDGAHVLRAKIDMSAKNMLMRDTILYRIRHAHHYRQGDAWCIYPLYDYAHPLSDAIEGITHSICTLEFENNREFYDWVVQEARELLPAEPHQYEFARLSLDYTMMSKRNLLKLVNEGIVSGWDDPRMPTIAGIRRRGVTPEALRDFAEMIGVSKANSQVDFSKLEYCIRNDLNYRAPRRMCVLDPLKVVISNYPTEQVEELEIADFPSDVGKAGARKVPFSREVYIERADFEENPPKGFHRLTPSQEVRLAGAYIIQLERVERDSSGNITTLYCQYDPESRSGQSTRKVKAAIHWVSAAHAASCEVRLYDNLFLAEQPGAERDFHQDLNPNSKQVISTAFVEPSVTAETGVGRYQFTRHGYFCTDSKDSKPNALVFNRIVSLRDSWAKASEAQAESKPAPTTVQTEAKASSSERERPNKKTKAQLRAETRAESAVLTERMASYQALGLSEEEADLLTGEQGISDFFEAVVAAYAKPESVAKWVVNEVLRESKDKPVQELGLSAAELGKLISMVEDGTISASAGKTAFASLVAEGGSAEAIVERLGLKKVADQDALGRAIDEVLAANADSVKRYREGKTQLLGFFVGQVMQKTKGSADPAVSRELLLKKLAE